MAPSAFWTAVVVHSVSVRLFMDGGNENVFFISEFQEIARLSTPAVFAFNWRNLIEDWDAVFNALRERPISAAKVALITSGATVAILACAVVPLSVLVSAPNPKSSWICSLIGMIVPQDMHGTNLLVGIACLAVNLLADSLRLFRRVADRDGNHPTLTDSP